jgi:hypothetical protein
VDGIQGYVDLNYMPDTPIISPPIIIQPTQNMFTMFSQQDPQWANMKLGSSVYTVGRYGCLSTVICMGYNWLFGKSITPAWIIPQLGYNSDGMLLWPSLSSVGLKLVSRISQSKTIPSQAIADAWKNPDVITALEINNGVHFVWQVGRWYPILGYRMVDPWTGSKSFTNKYGNNVTGLRVISKM